MKCYAICDEKKLTDQMWFLIFVDTAGSVFEMYKLNEETTRGEIVEIGFDGTCSAQDLLEKMRAKHGGSYV